MERIRWLSEDEQRTWRAFVDMVQCVTSELDRQLQHDVGIPFAYYGILARLSDAPDRSMRMVELADAVGYSASRLSHAVTRLEEEGWVARRRCATDKRGFFATLTDDGMVALAAAAPGHVSCVRRALFDALSPRQLAQLRTISEAVNARLATPTDDLPVSST